MYELAAAIIKQFGLKCLLGNTFYEPIPQDKGAINFGPRTQYLWSEVKERFPLSLKFHFLCSASAR